VHQLHLSKRKRERKYKRIVRGTVGRHTTIQQWECAFGNVLVCAHSCSEHGGKEKPVEHRGLVPVGSIRVWPSCWAIISGAFAR
jgi:hypothetical protein